MGRPAAPTFREDPASAAAEPLLEAGDWLSRDEFESRYEQMRDLKKAELIEGIVGSSRAYDLHQKKAAYARNGIEEYLAWVTSEHYVVWWALAEGEYREIAPGPDERIESICFPGLLPNTAPLSWRPDEQGS
jgi:hypothetical protein